MFQKYAPLLLETCFLCSNTKIIILHHLHFSTFAAFFLLLLLQITRVSQVLTNSVTVTVLLMCQSQFAAHALRYEIVLWKRLERWHQKVPGQSWTMRQELGVRRLVHRIDSSLSCHLSPSLALRRFTWHIILEPLYCHFLWCHAPKGESVVLCTFSVIV